jgi:hypothetical protein
MGSAIAVLYIPFPRQLLTAAAQTSLFQNPHEEEMEEDSKSTLF